MKLIELYSLATGLKIDHQNLTETFYPLRVEKYITLQCGSGMLAKNYPYYSEVVNLLIPILEKNEISIIQLGGKEDPTIPGCYSLHGALTIHQSAYILRKALCHFGNDSWLAHRAGEINVPCVILYGPTTPQNHGPYRFNPSSRFIESHRFGRKPSFASQEAPSTIAVIPPETVANQVLECLGFTERISRQSLYIGPDFNNGAIELVPDVVIHPSMRINSPIFIRMDYVFDERVMANNLALRQAAVITNREIDLALLSQLKSQIPFVKIEVDAVSPEWIRDLKKIGLKLDFYSAEGDEEKLRQLRLDLYDACLFDQFVPTSRDDFIKFAGNYLNKPLDTELKLDTLSFKTNKFVLSNGKVYLSKTHWQAGISTESSEKNVGQVIDDPIFWEECSYMYFFTS